MLHANFPCTLTRIYIDNNTKNYHVKCIYYENIYHNNSKNIIILLYMFVFFINITLRNLILTKVYIQYIFGRREYVGGQHVATERERMENTSSISRVCAHHEDVRGAKEGQGIRASSTHIQNPSIRISKKRIHPFAADAAPVTKS
jgi:hypothetical protein